MRLIKRTYQDSDFYKIRQFLIENYHPQKGNWLLDRWNFSRYASQAFHQTGEHWTATVGLWVDEANRPQAVVHSEGEDQGEVFLQLRDRPYTAEERLAFILHAEDHLFWAKDGKRHLEFHINQLDEVFLEELQKREYLRQPWEEVRASKELTLAIAPVLPKGLEWCEAEKLLSSRLGLAHAKAFGYKDNPQWGVETGVRVFKTLIQAPDYSLERCFALENSHSEVVAFCQLWVDPVNRYCVLEPVGTLPEYRGKGLGKAVVQKALNHAMTLGCNTAYVGSGDEFYRSLGFQPHSSHEIWSKDW